MLPLFVLLTFQDNPIAGTWKLKDPDVPKS